MKNVFFPRRRRMLGGDRFIGSLVTRHVVESTLKVISLSHLDGKKGRWRDVNATVTHNQCHFRFQFLVSPIQTHNSSYGCVVICYGRRDILHPVKLRDFGCWIINFDWPHDTHLGVILDCIFSATLPTCGNMFTSWLEKDLDVDEMRKIQLELKTLTRAGKWDKQEIYKVGNKLWSTVSLMPLDIQALLWMCLWCVMIFFSFLYQLHLW